MRSYKLYVGYNNTEVSEKFCFKSLYMNCNVTPRDSDVQKLLEFSIFIYETILVLAFRKLRENCLRE